MNKLLIVATILLALTNTFATPAYPPLQFPNDHGQHHETNFEWWNFFGHLVDSDQHLYGFSLTFLRLDVPPQQTSSPWETDAIYVSYFTVTDVEHQQFYYQESINRTSFDFAGASDDHLKVWNRAFSTEMNGDKMTLNALTKTLSLSLSLNLHPIKPLLLHGENGFFQMEPSPDSYSYYYSFPRLQGQGILTINGEKHPIIAASASMDHEFQSVKNMNMSWDRFVIQLENNEQIIVYLLTSQKDNMLKPNSFCVISLADGQSIPLKLSDFQLTPLATWKSPDSKNVYPSKWLLTIPQYNYRLVITPTVRNQEIITMNAAYWQGEATVNGEKNGVSIQGNASIELAKHNTRH